MVEFFEKIKHLTYSVQRNWENLPDSVVVGKHDDLDLFSSVEDKPKLLAILDEYPEIKATTDIRTIEDDYYPKNIDLLYQRKLYKDLIWIPNQLAHFNSLYYHNAVHKNDNPYGDKLRELFLKTYQPIRCVDEGVGYYDTYRNTEL